VLVECYFDDQTMRIDVQDDGAGIPEEDWDKVFTAFARLDDSRTRKSGGYGLGLSIVRRILYWHGGQAFVGRSEEELGVPASLWSGPAIRQRVMQKRTFNDPITCDRPGYHQFQGGSFDEEGRLQRVAQQEFRQFYPGDGWVEHDPAEIWESTRQVCLEVLHQRGLSAWEVAGIGITNQRETTIIWDRATGEPVYPAIVWQDRRTTPLCDQLRDRGLEPRVVEKTGLIMDPYFSATKVAWILEHVDGVRKRAEQGELAFGTIDTWLLWKLTNGRVHATDASNASRTQLFFNIHTQRWDDELLSIFRVPPPLLPEVRDSASDFGSTEAGALW